MSAPTLSIERGLLKEGYATIGSVDEVGRGSLAGPVSVGIVVVDSSVRNTLPGVRDSKELSPLVRNALVPKIREWALAYAVGHASPQEIDDFGIIGALRLAGHRALAQLGVQPEVILLDGSHDWFTPPVQASFLELGSDVLSEVPPVVTKVKADRTCVSVAAASVLAKVERDAHMVKLSSQFPAFGWEDNKGYASPGHIAALSTHGATVEHRRSWKLPGVSE
ncbi:MAG: ribonuclease HII [Actinobacteria bacterium]|uniref:Ribonuclease HII n=1 Tax=freshwater metagenome TaxID=449393 RepID=A0A6J7SCD9_9ZZZZ|nr:ribonuclease HII [Actinomycetota bacterium]